MAALMLCPCFLARARQASAVAVASFVLETKLMIRSYPMAANSSAIPRPIPREAPVIKAAGFTVASLVGAQSRRNDFLAQSPGSLMHENRALLFHPGSA